MDEIRIIYNLKLALRKLYIKDWPLIDKGLCERCLVHRLAVYFEELFKDFNVDCEFNKAFNRVRVSNKVLSNPNGNYVDIIVHKRSNVMGENLLCVEVKKEKNYTGRDKDRNNLEILTSNSSNDNFCYVLGAYIILGKTYERTRIEIYKNGYRFDDLTSVNNDLQLP